MSDLVRIIEALIFVSDTPIGRKRLYDLLPEYNEREIEAALDQLRRGYPEDGSSLVLAEVANGFQFRTRPEYREYVIRLKKTAPSRLSRGALETLAIIAYKQPVLRSEIECVRGVDVSGVVKSLLEKDLIRIIGRDKNLAGRPLVYGTTKKFLEVFDLKDLSCLPNLKEIKSLDKEGRAGTMELFEKDTRREFQ